MGGIRAWTTRASSASPWLLACLALPGAAQEGTEGPGTAGVHVPEAQEGPTTPEESGVPTTGYLGLDEADDLLSSWLGTGLCEELSLGESVGGRPLFGVQLGGWGQTPLSERTTVLLIGGLDGVSLSGSQAVVHAVDSLLATPDRLPDDVTFVAIPWANPDGLARALAKKCGDGRNDRQLDDDRDGVSDEDGPDDLDGDGMILELLIEDPAGEWVRSADARFLRRARPGEAPRYRRTLEGRDDDGDGRYNEDGPGGVALDENFPVGWRGPLVNPSAGSWPLSEPAAHALAELALTRHTAVALVFQGNHGGIVVPTPPSSGVSAAPAPGLETALATLRGLFSSATGRPLEPRGAASPGSAVAWLYTSLGALAAEVAVWGPGVEFSGSETVDARYVARDWIPASGARRGRPAPGELGSSTDDPGWARWLDDTRGGLGFVDWQPVDLGDGRQGLLGGWEPRTCVNPPPAVIQSAVEGVDRFVLEVAGALPRLDVELMDSHRDGDLCVLRARVRNTGALPTSVRETGSGAGLSFVLEVPEGVDLLAGSRSHDLQPVPGQSASRVLSWLLLAPEGSVFTLRVEAPWSAPIVREVRL